MNRQNLLRAALVLLASVCCSGMANAEPGSGSYAVAHWEMKDGLPLNKVRAITQTRDGYLWIGTFNGLARFDGVRFKVFDVANTPGLHNNAIETLCEDGAGRLWIGDNLGGLSVLADGQFRTVQLPTNWPGKPLLRIAAAVDGTVWVMNDEGRVLPLTNGIAGEPLAGLASPIALAADAEGVAWAAVAGRLCRLDSTLGAVPVSPRPEVVKGWEALFPARAGGLWILDDGWLRRWDKGRWVEDRGRGEWGTILLPAFLEGRSGQILGGSFKQGLRILDPSGSAEVLDESTGLSQNWAYCLCEDREGTLWVGTGNGGLNALYPRRVTMVNAPDTWHSSAVLSVTPAASGGLWIGTEGAGVFRWREGRFENLTDGERVWQSVINSVLEDRAGRLWVGTWGAGVRMLAGGAFRESFRPAEARGVVLTVFESSSGDIWLGTKGGAGRLHDGEWTWLEDAPGVARPSVRCFAEQAGGVIWFGLDGGGVCRWQDGKLTPFRASDGLASDYVRTLLADEDGALWIGTRGGLSRLKDGKLANVTARHGLPSEVICQILDDGKGHYWMSSFGGLFRVARAELNRCADGELKSVNCLVCDSSGGLGTLEVSEQGQPAGCRTSDGRLWFATGRGLAMVVPTNVTVNPLPPPVFIEEVLVDGEPLRLPASADGVLQVPPGGRRYEFRYTGLSFANPARVGFRHRLAGLETEWVEAGAQRSAFYTPLPPGDYRFQVTARNADGVWNEPGTALALRVLPQFWQTWWFRVGSRVGALVAVGLTVLVIVRRRARRKLAVLERQRALERERARIARDIHDDLGTSLTRIAMLSESARDCLARPQQAAVDLEEIRHTARDLTLQMSEIVWAVNPEHDTLDSFASYAGKFAHDLLSAANIRCRLDLPVRLPATPLTSAVRHNLFLAFKEALHNVVRHAAATEVQISLALADRALELTVADNGRGFTVPAGKGPGNGLANLRHRLGEVGGTCQLVSESGRGTTVRLCLQLRAGH